MQNEQQRMNADKQIENKMIESYKKATKDVSSNVLLAVMLFAGIPIIVVVVAVLVYFVFIRKKDDSNQGDDATTDNTGTKTATAGTGTKTATEGTGTVGTEDEEGQEGKDTLGMEQEPNEEDQMREGDEEPWPKPQEQFGPSGSQQSSDYEQLGL